MSVADNLERLTEAVDRLIIRLETLQAQRNKLTRRVQELEYRIENSVIQSGVTTIPATLPRSLISLI